MTDGLTDSIAIVRGFFDAKERHDLAATTENFAPDIQYVFPLDADGEPDPWFVYDGREATTEYQRATLERFSQIRMLDQQFTASADGRVVFATSHGDYIQADGDVAYRNVYVFRFVIADGQIRRVEEYANPVTFAKLAGLPIG